MTEKPAFKMKTPLTLELFTDALKAAVEVDCPVSESQEFQGDCPFYIYVAFSGGIDSTVLFDLTHRAIEKIIENGLSFLSKSNQVDEKQVNIRLSCIHVNHNLSDDADSWQTHCQSQCLERNVGFIAKSVYIDTQKMGLEAAAR